MFRFVIEGRRPLTGTVKASGAKNAVLPIMAASVMAGSPCVLRNSPDLSDVRIMSKILERLGATVERTTDGSLVIDPTTIEHHVVDEMHMRQVKSSIFLMGPVLGRMGRVQVSYPGGCDIGQRPIDLHIKGLKALGASIEEKHGNILAECEKWEGIDIHLDIPSVGATENIMMGACLASGVTIIRNAAKEPEIVDLQGFLNAMGARVKGAGTDVIRIEGVNELRGAEYTIMPDRIEVGTLMIGAVMTRGDVVVENAVAEHVQALTSKLREIGAEIDFNGHGIRAVGKSRPRPTDIKTLPYPGFPTDMQPQIMALLSIADGTSVITETIFDSRFKQAEELGRMGAKIRREGRTAIIKGVPALSGAIVEATDLRSGASLVLAGLSAEGRTIVRGVHNIDRGYERFEEKLMSLGASVKRVPEDRRS
ncbi:MAG TPA: UDP-N-acetylglucosamine 1-carboxyvinyltransferase [Firmicutes bacterium]|nr:UDP-N-acetylglucosamine 1-carboxyvinyltransferase [Candidatus Fermentithermobacillaceae bacterium]